MSMCFKRVGKNPVIYNLIYKGSSLIDDKNYKEDYSNFPFPIERCFSWWAMFSVKEISKAELEITFGDGTKHKYTKQQDIQVIKSLVNNFLCNDESKFL